MSAGRWLGSLAGLVLLLGAVAAGAIIVAIAIPNFLQARGTVVTGAENTVRVEPLGYFQYDDPDPRIGAPSHVAPQDVGGIQIRGQSLASNDDWGVLLGGVGIVTACLMSLLLGVWLLLGGGKRKKGDGPNGEETRQIQELCRSVEDFGRRIEALETILMAQRPATPFAKVRSDHG